MQTRKLGNSGLKVSVLGLGWRCRNVLPPLRRSTFRSSTTIDTLCGPRFEAASGATVKVWHSNAGRSGVVNFQERPGTQEGEG
jgi:hypothetical protein